MTQINKWIWFLFTILELPSNLSFPILKIESRIEKSDIKPRYNKSNTNQMAAVRIKVYAFFTSEILDDHEILIMMYKVFASNSSNLQCWRTPSLWVWTKNFLHNDGYITKNKQTNKNHVHTIWRKLNLFAPELKPFFSVFLMTTVLYLLGMEADAATNEWPFEWN